MAMAASSSARVKSVLRYSASAASTWSEKASSCRSSKEPVVRQLEAGLEIAERWLERRGGLGPQAGPEAELRDVVALVARAELALAEPELVHDVADPIVELLRGGVGEEEPPELEVNRRAPLGGDEGVCRLLHAIVEEPERGLGRLRAGIGVAQGGDHLVGVADGQEEALVERLAEARGHLRRCAAGHDAQRAQVEAVADARGQLERVARVGREPLDAPGDELDDVAVEGSGADGIEVPAPGAALPVEVDEVLLVELAGGAG